MTDERVDEKADASAAKKPRKRKTAEPPILREGGEARAAEAAPAPKPPRKRKAPAKAPKSTSSRALVRTQGERKQKLSRLASLTKKTELVEPSEPVVEPTAGPPPEIAPPVIYEPEVTGFIDRGMSIPEHYGSDRLVVLPRDEHWIFVYWELKGGSLDRLRFLHSSEIIDNARWVLNVHSLQDLSRHVVDVDIRAGQWYLKVAPAGHFAVSLGFMDQQGNYSVVMKEVEVRTPSKTVSPVSDERWIIEREELDRLLQASGASPREGVGTRMSRSELPRAIGVFSMMFANRPSELQKQG